MKRIIKKSSRVVLIKGIPSSKIIKGSFGTIVRKHTKTNTYDVRFTDFEDNYVIIKNITEEYIKLLDPMMLLFEKFIIKTIKENFGSSPSDSSSNIDSSLN